MKTTISITIDGEILRKAKKRTPNMSQTIAELLEGWCKIPMEELEQKESQKLKDELTSKTAEMMEMQKQLDKLKKEEDKKKKGTRIVFNGERGDHSGFIG